METKIQLRQSQWFYDDSGYYSYVLLNVPEDQFREIKKILRRKGLQVLLAGKSYRPASNGIQYQWYIRISDETGRHPSREKVNSIFASYETTEIKKAIPETELKKLADKVTKQEKEISRLKAALSNKELQYQLAIQRSEFLRKQNQELQAIYKKAQLELTKSQGKIHHLELRIREIQEKSLKPEDVTQIRQEYEATIKKLRQNLANKEKELVEKEEEFNSWMNSFDPELQKRTQEITDLKNQIAILEEEKKQLIDQIQEIRAGREVESKKENPEDLYRRTLSILLPNIKFLGGSLDTLWREMQDPTYALRILIKLPQLRAKRVKGLDEWLEIHLKDEWRLYFKKGDDSKYQVLISHKNTQKTDIEWLKHL